MTFNEMLPYILVGLAVLALIIAFAYFGTRKTNVVTTDKRDVLDEGAAPAQRNQALIDSPAAATKVAEPAPAPTPKPQPEPAPTPAPAPAPASAPTPGGTADDLRKIKGVGPKLVTLLNEQGITSFAQIAGWSDSDIARVDETLGRFRGRITRDNWVEQAKLLASGDESGFAEKFGQNG